MVAGGKYLQTRPDVDPNRIGIWGLSYGGLLTSQALARNSDIFKAGVDLAGVHLYGSSLDPEAVSYQSSAIGAIDGWKSPVLLIQGDDDRNVAFQQMTGLVQLLRQRDVYYELIVFPGRRARIAAAQPVDVHARPHGNVPAQVPVGAAGERNHESGALIYIATVAQSGSSKKIANSLVTASCAGVLAVYIAGYTRTQHAAEKFTAQIAERRPVVHDPSMPPIPEPFPQPEHERLRAVAPAKKVPAPVVPEAIEVLPADPPADSRGRRTADAADAVSSASSGC